ncbi:MAG: hypothetical protein AVDCRST_MAG52-2475, partial [uncultured Blastococcus sp.]
DPPARCRCREVRAAHRRARPPRDP